MQNKCDFFKFLLSREILKFGSNQTWLGMNVSYNLKAGCDIRILLFRLELWYIPKVLIVFQGEKILKIC